MKLSECEHEWQLFQSDYGLPFAYVCKRNLITSGVECNAELSLKQAEAILNEHALLEAKLTAIECGDCGLTMLECACDDVESE